MSKSLESPVVGLRLADSTACCSPVTTAALTLEQADQVAPGRLVTYGPSTARCAAPCTAGPVTPAVAPRLPAPGYRLWPPVASGAASLVGAIRPSQPVAHRRTEHDDAAWRAFPGCAPRVRRDGWHCPHCGSVTAHTGDAWEPRHTVGCHRKAGDSALPREPRRDGDDDRTR